MCKEKGIKICLIVTENVANSGAMGKLSNEN